MSYSIEQSAQIVTEAMSSKGCGAIMDLMKQNGWSPDTATIPIALALVICAEGAWDVEQVIKLVRALWGSVEEVSGRIERRKGGLQ